MRIFIYNLLLPVAFLGFIPGLLWKLWRRAGWKSTFLERFGIFGKRRARCAEFKGAIYVHAVSVGETMIALGFIRRYLERFPDRRFVLATTTTTGQALAREKAPVHVKVIFSPIDFRWMVRRTLDLLEPKEIVIFETELWPNLIDLAAKRGIPLVLANGRISDRSARGYRRWKFFFAPLLEAFRLIAAQSEADAGRFRSIAPAARIENFGNLKFDQRVPAEIGDAGLGDCFGPGPHRIVMTASTHPGEEALALAAFQSLQNEFPDLKLLLVPRHAERGPDLESMLKKSGVSFVRRSLAKASPQPVDCVLADTTGEMLKLMKSAEIVIMGKTLAGHTEGQNPIEPALLGKAIIAGDNLRNFRFVRGQLAENNGIELIARDEDLTAAIRSLLLDDFRRAELGRHAAEAVRRNTGATDRTIEAIEKLS